jgi:formate-dependent phosphoribosylglycinamide formyltransferase (GAR transformylase)
MQIGTPLSPSATRVMLLGSGELGKEVIIALQRLGLKSSPSIATTTPPAIRSPIAPTSFP